MNEPLNPQWGRNDRLAKNADGWFFVQPDGVAGPVHPIDPNEPGGALMAALADWYRFLREHPELNRLPTDASNPTESRLLAETRKQ